MSRRIRLRRYQQEAVRTVREGFKNHPTQLVVMPTGCGKTTVFSEIAREWPGTALIAAHRDELIGQARDRLVEQLGVAKEEIGVEQARSTVAWMPSLPKFVVGSVPTLRKLKRLERAFPKGAGPYLVIVDEAHHATAPGYRTVIDYFLGVEGSRVLGVTATPARAGIGRIFGHLAYNYSFNDALRDGWLVRLKQLRPVVEGLDFSKCRSVGGDYDEAQLEQTLMGRAADVSAEELAKLTPEEFRKVIDEEGPLHNVASVIHQEIADRQCIVFCVSIKHAVAMAFILDRYRPGRVAMVSGNTDPEDRKALLGKDGRFARGEVQIVTNCGVLTEGFDAPGASVVAMARPTQSLTLYTQVVGRVLRPLKGVVDWAELADDPEGRRKAIANSSKPFAMVLDFAGNAGKDALRPVDVFDLAATGEADEVKERAREIVSKRGGEVAVEDAIAEARGDMELLLEQREWLRRKHIKAEATYRLEEVEYQGGGHAHTDERGQKSNRAERAPGDEPTPGMVRHLRWLGVAQETIDTYTRRQAHAVINSMRKAKGLPTR